MIAKEQLHDQWQQVADRLKEHWSQLTDEDLRRAEGNGEQLVGVVQARTGAARAEIENFVTGVLSEARSTSERIADTASDYADTVQRVASEQVHRAVNTSKNFATEVGRTVRQRPAESLLIAFGVGVAAGAVFFLNRRK